MAVASNAISPAGTYNHCQFDFWSPKTTDTALEFRTSGGTAFCEIDPVNTRIRIDSLYEKTTNGALSLGTLGTGNVNIKTNNTTRWTISGATGALSPATTTTYDIGTASLLVSVGYFASVYSSGANINVGTLTTHDVNLRTNNTTRWTIGGSAGHITPAADATYDVGGSSAHANNGYFRTINSNSADLAVGTVSAHTLNLKTTNTTRWSLTPDGQSFYPATDGTLNIGDATHHVNAVNASTFVSALASAMTIGTNASQVINFRTNSTSRWTMGSGGNITPFASLTYDIGSGSAIVQDLYIQRIDFRGTQGTSSKAPQTVAPDAWAQVRLAGTTYYAPLYAAS